MKDPTISYMTNKQLKLKYNAFEENYPMTQVRHMHRLQEPRQDTGLSTVQKLSRSKEVSMVGDK